MKDYTFEELLPRYVTARQKIRHQRNELRALNKSIKWEQAQRQIQFHQIQYYRGLWDQERKKKMPPAPQAPVENRKAAFVFMALVIGLGTLLLLALVLR